MPGLSKHYEASNSAKNIPKIIQKIAIEYDKKLKDGQRQISPMPEYSFARFSDRTLITSAMREVVRLRLVECKDPFRENVAIASTLSPENPDDIFNNRVDHILEYLFERHNQCKSHLDRLWKHPVIGLVWRFWRLLINPNI